MYDGVGDYSEGHVYLKDTGEERSYVASVTRDLGITALPGDLGTSWVLRTKEPRALGPWAHRSMAGHGVVWCPHPLWLLSLEIVPKVRGACALVWQGQPLCAGATSLQCLREGFIIKPKDERPGRPEEGQ